MKKPVAFAIIFCLILGCFQLAGAEVDLSVQAFMARYITRLDEFDLKITGEPTWITSTLFKLDGMQVGFDENTYNLSLIFIPMKDTNESIQQVLAVISSAEVSMADAETYGHDKLFANAVEILENIMRSEATSRIYQHPGGCNYAMPTADGIFITFHDAEAP